MVKSTRQKHARNQEYRSLVNVSADFNASTARKLSLSALTTVLTAATCLGGQPLLASSNILLPPTTAAFASQVSDTNTTPWLHTPNILEFQRYRFVNSNGTPGKIEADGLGDYDNTTKKSDMYAHLEKNGNDQYLIFDVFFNNDGKDMTGASKQQQYVWQIPFAVADLNNGYYNKDTLSDLSFDFYKRNGTSPQTTNAVLSRDFSLFTKENSQSKNLNDPLKDDQHLGNSLYKITLGIRGGNSNKQDLSDTFHNNAGDGVISNATTLRGVYSGKSYGIGLRTTNVDYAVHMHCKVKLRQGVTLDDIQDAYTWANTSTYGRTTNSAYTFISGRERWTEQNLKRTKSDRIPPKLYFNDKEISDSNNSITVYQGDSPTIKFGTSDDSGKVTKFSVSGFPDFAKNGNVDEKNDNGIDASESKPYTKVINKTTFIHKDKSGNPVNSDYEVTISATDASGNKVEKKVTVHLKNLNQKYKEPTATPITVDWGHKLTENDLKPHVTGIEGGGQLVFNPFPPTNIPQEYFNGKETLTTNASAKVVYSDNSYHVVTIPVNIKKPLSLQHKSELKDHTVEVSVKDKLTMTKDGSKVDAKEYLGITDKKVKDNIKSAEWVNGEPSTDVAGKRTYTAKVTFNDGSTAEEKVTFTVRPQKPKIETDLTGVAGVKGKEVVVNAGPGTAGSTVTLKDNGKNTIGTGTVGADGKVTIKVDGGIPAGNVTAVTSTNPADPAKEQSVQSPVSEPKNATKDDKAPTLTADKDSFTVKVGDDLKIQLTAKDDVKIESIDTATATMAFARNDLSKMMAVAARAKTDYTTNTDKEKVFTYSFSGFKPEEVDTYTLTFSATDAAGHKTEKTVTVKVEKKEDLTARNITVDLGQKLDEKLAKKAIANSRKLPKGTTFAWATDGKPDTSTVGKEKTGKVIVTIPTNDPKNPRVETVAVKVTVKDSESPKVTIQQKGDGGTYNTINGEYPDGPKHAPEFTIITYRGDKNDIKITATDNSGEVTTLTLTPKTPGETEKASTGTGTDKEPKTLMLDDTTPLNTKPGEYKRTITAVDPSGNTTNVAVKFVVKTQADKYSKVTGTPVTYNMSSGTKHPDPKSGINADDLKKLPSDATYSWAKEPDWNKPGEQKDAKVRITFKDGSTKDVTTTVTVKDNIAPVINTPSTNKAKRADTDKTPEYYQFKVHNGKPFSIDINAYDNSGKIKSATIPTFPGHDGKITIDNQNGNSAEKPATIHIKGTAQRDANITNSSDNKWSRELVVTDEAGNESKLKVQISVYTDAEEHNAAPSPTSTPVKNPTDNNAITNAITITKKDDPNSTVDRSKLTFKVGDIPKTNGIHAVPVTITYPDGSTTTVEVPVLIKLQNKIYKPTGNKIEVPWHSNTNELINKIKNVSSLAWENNNKPKQDPTVTIVDNSSVPSTDKPGESQVQVKVTYSDGSSDVATVTVKVLDPQNKDYTPEGQTIKVDYSKTKNTTIEDSVKKNGIKLKKNGADTTLPTDATVTIDSNSTIPDGTQPGDFTVPVTITYGDGSTDHATVTVKVGEPQNKKYEPNKPDGINVGYGKTKPSDNDIIAKVKFDDKNQPPTDGTKITVDDGQTPIDTTTPGTVNVKVTVKYPDGSEDHVEVPVTVGNPDNVTHKASATPIELKRNKDNTNKPSEDDIKKHVTTDVDKTKKQPTITVDTDKIPTTDKTGTTNVPVTIKYEDGTTTTVQVPVIVTDTNADEYTPNVDPVEEPYGTGKEKTKEAVTAAVTVPDWPDKDDKAKPQPKVTITSKDEDIPDGTKPGTYHVNVDVTYPDGTVDKVTVDVTIKNKQSDTFEPKAKPVVKPYGTKVTSDDVTKNVTVPNWPEADKDKLTIELNDPNQTLPDGKTPKTVNVKVKVTYPDGTTDTVDVPVTISNKQSELYPPKADNLEKDNGQKPSDDEIIGKVSVPTWPTNETNKPTYSIAEGDKSKIPNGDKAGKFEVPVTVTYPDGSTIVINVPVTIKAPTATAKVVTVPKGVEPKPEDSIANKDKFPEGTQFEWKKDNGKETGKPDTSSEGNKSGIVVVTVPGQAPVEVPVTVNVVDPSAPQINVPQGKDLPKPEDVINGSTDKTKYPEGTKFEWSKEDTPDTKNPGTKNGKIIVTIPGQAPVKVPVTVNVLPKPEANVVNVPLNGTLPEAKDVIKDSTDKNKFPNGTTFEWEDSGKPTTDTVGEKTGGKVKVTIPGVNGKSGYTIDVPVTVNVNPAPIAKETSVAQNSDPDPKNSIKDNDKLPEGTTFEWKKDAAPKTDKPGTTTGTVIVKIPGQEPQEVPVKITVTASPEGKDVTVLQKTDGKDNTPQPKDVIKNNSDLPENAKTSWKKKPDTSKTGNQPGIVTVKVPGEPDVDIPVNVLVVPNPAGKTVSVHVGDSPSAENSIANKDELPNGTKFAWATNGTPDTKTAGNNKSGTVVVTIPGIANPVNVPVTVNVVAQNKPFINGGKAENTPDKSDKTTITGKTQPGNTVTVKDNDGNTVGTGDANKDGNFTIEIDKKDPGTTLKLVPNKGGVDGDATTVIVTAKPQKPTITVPTDNQKNDGNVTVTPPTGDTTVVKIEINAKPNSINGPEQPVRTIIAKKDNDGKWKIDGDAPDGVTVDPKTGVVTITAKNLEDGSTITAVSKNKTDKPSDPATAVTGFKTPQISEQTLKDNPDDSTKQIITGKTLPGATVTVTDKDGKQIGTGVADKNGNFTITINKQTPDAIVNLTPTNGTGDFAKTGNTVEVTVGGDIAVPRIDTPADGSATITPNLTDTRIDKVVITYTPEGNGSTPQTVTITVIAEGDKRVWKIDGTAPNGVTVDPKTGVVMIPAANVKDGSTITAVAKNSGDSTSSTVTGTIAQPGDGGSGNSGSGDSGSGDSGSDDDDNGGSSDSGSHDSANNANNANNAKNNGNKNDASSHNGSNNHGNQSHNSGSNSGSRRGKGALGNTGVGVALSALASAMLAGMGAAGRAVSRRKKRN
ncbi:peptidase [Gardnerella vaginalis]|uniref:Rib/alpha-like domain-containing protein n=1 Tax=Gardnerella vaginalis TaxID=2702 RepID=UPI000E20FB26|nr:Rib/alpha-like domain-containing protein [Gardnerella vaginalis]RDW97125.1 peptidase [Gardnerella vaginalis]RDW97758.1 peptidase [Gardnerella vaginalis]